MPDGRNYLFVNLLDDGKNDICIGSLDSEKRETLVPGATMPIYVDVEPGCLLFLHENALYAQPFDADTQKLSGDSRRIAENLLVDPINICSDIPCILPAWSPDGSQIAFSTTREGNHDIFRRDASGTGEEVAVVKTSESEFLKDWSRKGQYIAYGATKDLYAIPLTGKKKSESIIESHSNVNTPAFSPDEKWVTFFSDETGTPKCTFSPFPLRDNKNARFQTKEACSLDGKATAKRHTISIWMGR